MRAALALAVAVAALAGASPASAEYVDDSKIDNSYFDLVGCQPDTVRVGLPPGARDIEPIRPVLGQTLSYLGEPAAEITGVEIVGRSVIWTAQNLAPCAAADTAPDAWFEINFERPHAEPEPVPNLSGAAAKRYIRKVLHGFRFHLGLRRRITHCHRLSDVRIRCNKISWYYGDVAYSGWVTVWNERAPGQKDWDYAYKLKKINYYCIVLGRPKSKCTKTYRDS